ncbi:MAG: DUF4159 domain-containing protein [Kiritimatiellaeota bacterium]|nr:DUF4159 domain-containing protein [Kiritimatiellota bacterium]
MKSLSCAIVLLIQMALGSHAQINPTWNATPNDVNNLLKSMKDMIGVNYNMQIKSLGEVSADASRDPILFRSGHYNYQYTDEQRQRLRAYMLGGGMIIFNTGLGSAPFYRSTVKELAAIFPEQPLQRLTADHPIFHSYYDLDRVNYLPGVAKSGYAGNEPWFDAIELNCRVVALVSRWCLAVGWEDFEKPEFQAYTATSAKKLGVNIFSYASAMRAWAKNAANSIKFVDKNEGSADQVAMVQVVYDGVWKTRHAGLSVLLQTFNQKTEVPVKYRVRETRLKDPRIFDAPLLYLTGHEYFTVTAIEAAQLKKYLENGGFLFAEACCGRKGFDLAFRQLMQYILPSKPLREIPLDSPVFRSPNDVRKVGVTPMLQQDLNKTAIAPRLEGVDFNGHYSVIYSPYGMAGGWEMSQSPYARGYDDSGSQRLGQNILMYAVTQ